MKVFPSNNSNAHKLEEEYPGRMGLLMSPDGWRSPKLLPYALDNGRFSVWSSGKDWSGEKYLDLLQSALVCGVSPSWVAVPDVVTDAAATFDEWEKWKGTVRKILRGVPLALVVQDGMTPEAVKQRADPDVIFVGGTNQFKWSTLWTWCRAFPRVHVGRVNGEKWLWKCDQCGVESCDGTGWFRGDKKQLAGLHRYLTLSSLGLSPAEVELEVSKFSYGKTGEGLARKYD